MPKVDDLRAAIAALEAQRDVMGDAAFELAVAGLHRQLDELESPTQSARGAERKQVTVMFADLSGFTGLAERTDAEEVRNLVNACFERLGEVVTRYGGYIDKFIGDELMVLWGAPVAMEDHASRALYASLDILGALEAFNAERPELKEQPLGLHLGLNSGLVVAGAIGTETRREYTAMGDAVNVAARLVARAQSGEILVGADTRRLAGDYFEFEDRGAVELKGRTTSQQVFRLLRARSVALEVGRQRLNTPMVARESEFAKLLEAFRQVTAGRQSRSVAVVGPAGIGKSRLLREFQNWLEETGNEAILLPGAALHHMADTPYYAIGDVVRNWLGVKETDSAAEVRTRLEAALADAAIRAAEVPDALAAIMAVEYSEDSLTALSPEERRDRIFSAFAIFVRELARSSPVVLALEDVHWADDLSLDLLEHIFGELSDTPVLFLSLSRPITDTARRAAQIEARLPVEAHTRIVLRELSPDASHELGAVIAPGLDHEVIQTIVRKGQGNPFFIEEIVATLVDRGVLVRQNGGVAVTRSVADVTVPDTVWGVLAERIDRLPSGEKLVIQNAAIVGRVFWEGLVADLAAVRPRDALVTLNERDFVHQIGPAAFADDWEWTFRHVLVQEVAYSGLLRETRKAGHLRAAAWLERWCGDRRNEYSTLLAHHYQHGEMWNKSAECAELAGDRAASLFAHREARASFFQAIDSLSRLDDPEPRRRQVDVTLKLAKVAYFSPTEEVWRAFEAAKEIADAAGDEERSLRVSTAMAAWLYMAGRARQAVELAMQCMAGATRAQLEELLIVPNLILGRLMFATGEYEQCIQMIEKSDTLAEKYGVQISDRMNLSYVGMAYEQLGQPEKGQALCLEALRLAEQSRDLRSIALAHLYLGVPACLFGRWEMADYHLRQAMALGEQTGDQSIVYVALGFIGHWYAQTNQLEQAIESLDRSLKLAAELDTLLLVPLMRAYRADAEIRAGRADDAVLLAEAAVELARETRQKPSEADAHRILGWARYCSQPKMRDAAEQEFRSALELHRQTRSKPYIIRTLYELADYLRLVEDESEAIVAEAEASEMADELPTDRLPLPLPLPQSGD